MNHELEAENSNQKLHQQLKENLSTAPAIENMTKPEAEEYLQREISILNQNAKILRDELTSNRQFVQPTNDQSDLIPILQQIDQIEVIITQRLNELECEENTEKELNELRRQKDALYEGMIN
jgi:ABC-type transport system involved in cytochrome bd biosynthesis fused ATPase/permease subunit